MSEYIPSLGWLASALFFALLALLVWVASRIGYSRAAMPPGDIIYQDNDLVQSEIDTIYSPKLGLVGRPDYLVQDSDGSIVPVEIKSSSAPLEPYDGHVLQLAAYCLLVEEAYGIRPSHGILQYRDGAFTVDFTYDLEADLLDLLDVMREDKIAGEALPNHNDRSRCANCSLIAYCDHSLL
jgi:CRISPR-associated exonuclease Cas4